jgi:DNA polymerase III subunit epsilon
MLNLFNKNYPEFWKKYTESFNKNASKYVVLSLETSGINPEKDVIMAISATAIVDNRIIINQSFELYIQQIKTADLDLSNDFISVSQFEKVSENAAIETLINFLSNSIIVGHRVGFDIEMINKYLSKLKLGKLRNEAYDVEAMYNKIYEFNDKPFSLEEMCKKMNVNMTDRNSVSDDVYTISLLFLKMKSKLKLK